MSELKTWEDGELIGLLRSEIQYVEDFTDTGRLADVVVEIETRLNQSYDKLEDYLRVYSKETLEIIRAEKKQLVTADEFYGLHQEKLAAEREVTKHQERCNRLKKTLTDIIELSEPLDNDTLMSVVANIAGETLTAIEGVE